MRIRQIGVGALVLLAAIIMCQRVLVMVVLPRMIPIQHHEDRDPRLCYYDWTGEIKERTADAVIDGKLTLLEAAAVFRMLEEDPRRPMDLPHYFTTGIPGATVEEKMCREVIEHVRGGCRGKPNGVDLIDCLEAELNALVESGMLQLPDPPSGYIPPVPTATCERIAIPGR